MKISAELTSEELTSSELMVEMTLRLTEHEVKEAVAEWLARKGLSVLPENLETMYSGQYDSIDFSGFSYNFSGFSYKFMSEIPKNPTPSKG